MRRKSNIFIWFEKVVKINSGLLFCLSLSGVAEDAIRAYFESHLVLLEAVFPLACHRLCESPDFSLEFGFKSQPQPEGKKPDLQFRGHQLCQLGCF